MEEDVKKEVILSKLDYAIKCVREMKQVKVISDAAYDNMAELLIEIEKEVRDY